MDDNTKNSAILVVDDDSGIRRVLRLLLEAQGYAVITASDGAQALEEVKTGKAIDLIILDIMMPGIDGVETCGEIRRYTTAPVLFLTAKTQEADKLDAYAQGGDDFLGKPFSQAELLAKVNSLLRRYIIYKGKIPDENGIELDKKRRGAIKNGEVIELTDLELNIFEFLMSRRGSVVSARELYENVWGEKFLASSTNTVMVHILNLRKKIEDDAANPKFIRTVWGKGYQID